MTDWKNNQPPTLCLDCAKATNEDACPWVRSEQPVHGWSAVETHIHGEQGFDTYRVVSCPLFKRDAFRGGSEWRFGHPRRTRQITDDITTEIAVSIIEQAIDDWRRLERLETSYTKYAGAWINRAEVVKFFHGKWFEKLLASVTELEPNRVREVLGIPELEGSEAWQN